MNLTSARSARKGLILMLAVSGLIGCQNLPWRRDAVSSSGGRQSRSGQIHVVNTASTEAAIGKITPQQEADVQFAHARLLEGEGEYEQAISVYTEVIKRDKSRTDACHRLGILTCMQSKYEQSNEWFNKALKGDPANSDICCDFGYSMYLQGKFEKAESTLTSALAANPNHNRAHNNLGLVYAHSNRLELAIDEFCKGGASTADAHSNVALALALDGDLEEARRLYQRAVELDENCIAAINGLKELESALATVNQSGVSVVGGIE